MSNATNWKRFNYSQEFAGALNFMGAIDRQRNKVPIAHDLAKVMVDCWTTFARTYTIS